MSILCFIMSQVPVLHHSLTLAGTYGTVFKARDNGTGEIVALKIVRLDEDDEVQSWQLKHRPLITTIPSSGCSECSLEGDLSA